MKKCLMQARIGLSRGKTESDRMAYLSFLIHEEPMIMVLEIIITCLVYFLPVLFSMLWTRVLSQFDHLNYQEIVLMCLVGGLNVAYFWFTESLDTIFRNKVSVAMQTRIHEKSKELCVEEFDSPVKNVIIERSREIFSYGDGLEYLFSVLKMCSCMLSWVSAIILSSSYHPAVVLVFVVLPIGILVKLHISKKVVLITDSITMDKRSEEDLAKYLIEFNTIKETKINNLKNFMISKWERAKQRTIVKKKRIRLLEAGSTFILEIVDVIVYGSCIGILFFLYHENEITIAEIVGLFYLLSSIKNNIQKLVDAMSEYRTISGYVDQGFKMFSLRSDKTEGQIDYGDKVQMICLRDVSYTYDNNTVPAVKNVELKVRQGETIAIVGDNGAGKSTLAKLLCGLYFPSRGNIAINGVNTKAIAADDRFRPITAVFQDYNHYGMTVTENIVFKKDPPSSTIKELMKKKLKFIADLPEGDETILMKEFSGQELSGGQWQQIAIVRAWAKEADIIVLDEPTSAIDPQRENELYSDFRKILQNKIGVIISHRLGITSLADKIVVMDKGIIVEEGTQDELLAKGGIYAKMWNEQKSLYID